MVSGGLFFAWSSLVSRDEFSGFDRFSGREERLGEEEGQWDSRGDTGCSVERRYYEQFYELYAIQVWRQCGELDISWRSSLYGQCKVGVYYMVGFE